MNVLFDLHRVMLVCFIASQPAGAQTFKYPSNGSSLVSYFTAINRETEWRLVQSIPLDFRTFHPQGMVKLGESYYLSSVEKFAPTQKYEHPRNGYDRSPGAGRGHLFQFDGNGRLLADILLGKDIIYHPGGIDFDGKYLWIPVAEYRPNSRSIIYRIDPEGMCTQAVFQCQDHIGALVCDPLSDRLYGYNWGSRKCYIWQLSEVLAPGIDSSYVPPMDVRINGNHYIDYQDCHYLAGQFALCSGLSKHTVPGVGEIALGGIELVDLEDGRALHQVPISLWKKPDLVINNNPFHFEWRGDRWRFYFVPEDDASELYIYEAIVAVKSVE